jgi:hypothetical protein
MATNTAAAAARAIVPVFPPRPLEAGAVALGGAIEANTGWTTTGGTVKRDALRCATGGAGGGADAGATGKGGGPADGGAGGATGGGAALGRSLGIVAASFARSCSSRRMFSRVPIAFPRFSAACLLAYRPADDTPHTRLVSILVVDNLTLYAARGPLHRRPQARRFVAIAVRAPSSSLCVRHPSVAATTFHRATAAHRTRGEEGGQDRDGRALSRSVGAEQSGKRTAFDNRARAGK